MVQTDMMAAEKSEAMENQAQASGETQQDNKEMESLPPEMLIKHPLQNKWTLWFFRNARNKAWEDNLCEITSFDTVEDFWALHNHIEVASNLAVGCDYCLFKHGVKPMWEDDRNKNGGRWLLNLARSKPQELDNTWLNTILCLIGEAFEEYSDEICGAVVNVRSKGNKISVWTSHADKEDSILRIGRKLKEVLNIADNSGLGYQSHEDTSTRSGSVAKNRYVV